MSRISFDKRMTESWIYPVICEERDKIEIQDDWFSFLDEDCNDNRPFRIFIQIPICSEICEFCPYYKEHLCDISKETLDLFIDSIIDELRFFSNKSFFRNRKVSTVCIGGGDPSAIPIDYWNRIFLEINTLFDVSELNGISMEGTVHNLLKPGYIDGLCKNNVNRVSFGIQTFDNELKKKLNVSISNNEIFELVKQIKKSTIKDYSFDMMYNMPDQTESILREDLKQAVELEPQYIDIHGMDVYPDTDFFNKVYNGKFRIKPNRTRESELYKVVQDFFSHTKYNQVSSNLYSINSEPFIGYKRYLLGYPMLGIGPSARSYINRHSFQNVLQINRYIDLIKKRNIAVEYAYVASLKDDMLRKMVFFPSLTWIDKNDIVKDNHINQIINDLLEQNYVFWDDSKLKLTPKSKMFAGNISRLFYSQEQKEREFINLINMIRSQRMVEKGEGI